LENLSLQLGVLPIPIDDYPQNEKTRFDHLERIRQHLKLGHSSGRKASVPTTSACGASFSGIAKRWQASGSVKLTAAGHTFLREANDILNRVARSRVEARCPVQGGTGTLSIGYVGAASFPLFAGVDSCLP
jgi:hypothetical protein